MENGILNLGILAHVDAGKTTLTESLLYHSKIVKSMGTVDKGTATTDSMELEKARGITIRASTVSFNLDHVKVNLIDTPGHADFIGEVERSLRVLDGVILVVSAVEGVQPQTRILFRHLQRMKMPTLIFVNKIDRVGANYKKTCQQISDQLSSRIVMMQEIEAEGSRDCRIRPYSCEDEEYVQQIVPYSEKLLERFLDEQPILERDLISALRFRVQKGRLYPVYGGTALRDIGVVELMKGIVSWLPVREPASETKKPLSAYIYKVEFDEKNRKKAYFRVFSGRIAMKEKLQLAESETEITINNLTAVVNGKQVQTTEIPCNDIGILMDVPEIRCGDFIGNIWKQKGLIAWGEPMLRVGINPLDPGERFRLLNALKELETEDPLLNISIDPESQEIQVNLFGRLQVEILEALIRDRFHIQVSLSDTRTICKAKPVIPVTAKMRIREEGNLHCAGIAFSITPLEAGTGNQYETRVSFGYLQKPFQNAVREGVERALQEGLGDSIVDTKVTFTDADFESVSSTPADYRRLAPLVIRKALRSSGLDRLEPVMTYQLLAPISCDKKVMAALRKIEAVMEDVVFSESEMTVTGQVPYDNAKDFQIDLRTMTGGQGIFEMEFLEYRKVNQNL